MGANDHGSEQEVAYFRALLRKRGVETLACPTCGADAWAEFADLALPLATDRRNLTSGRHVAGSVDALLASCERCGFIALFDREVVRD